MNTKSLIPPARLIPSAAIMSCCAALLFPAPAPAETYLIESSTAVTLTGNNRVDLTGEHIYEIADSATLTFTRETTDPTTVNLIRLNANSTLIIRPEDSTGMVVFENATATARAAGILLNGVNTRLEITNAIFQNLVSLDNPITVISADQAASYVGLDNVIFRDNWSSNNTGVMRVTGTLEMTGGGFYGNYAIYGDMASPVGSIGAIGTAGTPQLTFTDVVFDGNRARTNSGAVFHLANNVRITYNNTIFTNNWAGTFGGAIYGTENAGVVTFNYTASGATTDYHITGNAALSNATLIDDNAVINNYFGAVPVLARAGGFYYGTNASGTVAFNIDAGATLHIGAVDAPNRNYDTLASSAALKPLFKRGAGDLILNADNAYWDGSNTIEAGRLLLGNNEARFGGNITVRPGATFGGAGTWITLNQSSARVNRLLTAQTGAIIQVGNGNPGDRLVISDTLNAQTGVTFNYDLFSGNISSLLEMNSFIIAGTGTINIGMGASGTFTLATWQNADFGAFSGFDITGINTIRWGASLNTASGTSLQLEMLLANSSSLAWTGASNAVWQAGGALTNWSGQTSNGAVQDFEHGDTVWFDSVADTANSANRVITIAPASVNVAAITVTGGADYTFTGGAIVSAGGLLKTGTGTLTFSGTATNDFGGPGGITLADGALAISNASHIGGKLDALQFAAGSITRVLFNDDVTFTGLAANDQRIVLADAAGITTSLEAAAGKTFSIQNATTASDGAFASIGAGNTLTLTNARLSNNTAAGNGGAIHNRGDLTINNTLSGTTTHEGNTAAAGGFLWQDAGATTTITTAANTTLVIGGADTSKDTIAGLAGSTITKTGAGALILNADSATHAGAFTVSAGSLLLGNAAAKLGGTVNISSGATAGGLGEYTGAVNLAAGSTLLVGIADTPSTLAINNLSLDGGTLAFDLFDGGLCDFLNVASLTSLSGVNTFDVGSFRLGTFNIGSIAAGDITTLVATSNVTIGGFAQSGRQLLALSATGNNLYLTGAGDMSRILTWTGATNTAWETVSANWSEVTGVNLLADGDRVIFDASSPTSTHAINIPGARITVSDMIVDGAANYTFTGGAIVADVTSVISGTITNATGKLTKDGTGTLTLANSSPNDFKGGIDLKAGTLALAAAGVTGTSEITATGANATLQIAADGLTLANTLNIAAASTLALDTQSHAATLSGRLTGSGILAKIGSGTLALTGSGAFTGTTRLDAGALALANSHALGAPSALLAINNASSSVILAASSLSIANDISLGANTLVIDTLSNTGTLAGVISGAGGLAKKGAGTLALTGANTFTGVLAIDEGVVRAGGGVASLGAQAATVSIADGATLLLAPAAPGAQTLDRALTGEGLFSVSLADAADNFSFAAGAGAAFSGTVHFDKGTITLDDTAAAALANTTLLKLGADATAQKASGDLSLNALAFDGGTLQLATTTTLTTLGLDGLLTVGTLDTGAGVSRIAVDMRDISISATQENPPVPPNPGIFEQTVTDFRFLAASEVQGTGAFTLVDLSGAPEPAKPIALTQNGQTVANATYGNTIAVQTIGNQRGLYLAYGITAINVLADETLVLDNTNATQSTLTAVISGAGSIDVQASDTPITLAAASTFTGTTFISRGTLRAGAANALAGSAALVIAGDATFNLNSTAQTVRNLEGAGDILLGSAALTVNSTADTEFSGVISGAGSLVKTGAGATLTLSNDNQHTGGSTVSAGRLRVTSPLALGTGPISVAAAATLEFNNAGESIIASRVTGGGRIDVIDSNVTLIATNNIIASLNLTGNSLVIAAGRFDSLGGSGVAINVGAGSTLAIADKTVNTAVRAGSLTLDGGWLLLYPGSTLDVQGAVSLVNDGMVTFGGSGKSRLSYGSAATPFLYDVPRGMSLTVTPDGSNAFDYLVVNQAASPMKDIVMTFNALGAVVDTVNNHIGDHFLLPVAEMPESRRGKGGRVNSAWVSGFGATADYETTTTQVGHTDRTWGMIAGRDVIIGGRFLAGGYIGFASNKMETCNAASISAEQPFAGLYGAWRHGMFYANADITAGVVRSSATRVEIAGQTATTYKTRYLGAGVGTGLVFSTWKGGQLKPGVSVRHMKAKMLDFTERGSGAMLLPGFSDNLTQGLLTMQASQKFTLLRGKPSMVDLMVGWKRNLRVPRKGIDAAFMNDPSTIVTLEGEEYDRNTVVTGLSLRTAIRENIIVSLGCDFECTSNLKGLALDDELDMTLVRSRKRASANLTVRFLW